MERGVGTTACPCCGALGQSLRAHIALDKQAAAASAAPSPAGPVDVEAESKKKKKKKKKNKKGAAE